MATSFSSVGRSFVHGEGPEKVTGRTVYGVDMTRPGMLWGKTLRSPLPHARIVSIDTSRAKCIPGIYAVLTGDDVPTTRVGRFLRDMPVLAQERVLFIGEKVAAVAAESFEVAEEALLAIDVEYDELPTVFDPLEALQPGAPILHPDVATYRGLMNQLDGPTNDYCFEARSKGDIEQGFAESDRIFEHTFTTQLVHQGYLEPHACLVDIDPSGRVQVWASNKSPYLLREQLASGAGIPESDIVIVPSNIGGDFGGKGDFMDVPLCYQLAKASGRPVKMVMSYLEELLAGNPRHPSVITVKTGVKNDGTMVASHVYMVFNSGAYGSFSPRVLLPGARRAAASYRIPHGKVEMHMVYTNAIPCGHMRAPGEVQAVFAVESHIDMIAREMGRDPYEFRMQNVVHEGDTSLVGDGYAEVRGEETLVAAADAGSWGQPQANSSVSSRAVGRGFSFAERRSGPGETTATLTLGADGHVTLHTPVWDTGTGAQTVLQQIISEELSVAVEDVRLDILNTDQLEFDTGVGGTRTTNTSGGATYRAAQVLRDKLIDMASGMRQWPADQVVLRDGGLSLRNSSEGALSLQELAAHALAETGEPLVGEVHHRTVESDITSFCAQVAEVEVDTETGQIEVTKFVTAHDVGTVLNPLAHQGQIEGAFVQGFGQALIEEMQTQDGRVSTLSLGDYKLPTENDLPELVTIHVSEGPSGPIPYQGKGIGEAPIGGVAPAIANAIEDAVGVRITDLPITAEKVLRAMREKGA